MVQASALKAVAEDIGNRVLRCMDINDSVLLKVLEKDRTFRQRLENYVPEGMELTYDSLTRQIERGLQTKGPTSYGMPKTTLRRDYRLLEATHKAHHQVLDALEDEMKARHDGIYRT